MSKIIINNNPLRISELFQASKPETSIVLGDEARKAVFKARTYIDEQLAKQDTPFYGINTGFGALCNTRIPDSDITLLQENLVRSHACGMGERVPKPLVRLMLFLKIKSLSYGHSGVSIDTVERLIDMYNQQVYPLIYQQGSLGASGDLAPLAHLSLPLIGEGEAEWEGQIYSGAELNKQLGWQPLKLQSKEGLALLNGTQFMSAYGAYLTAMSYHFWDWATLIAAISLDAFDGRLEPFHALLQQVRPHAGQLHTAQLVRAYLKDSSIAAQSKSQVQDPYSFRCVPQVHGASWDVLQYVAHTLDIECNAVTDNPTVFPEQDIILSGGNFHGQPLALALDMLCIALHEIGSISERRTYQLINGHHNLPAFLTLTPGLHSGFMIAQYTAASIVSQSKTLCMPASVDTIDSSKGQEDHVSMGANAATKCYRVLDNTGKILAIELLTTIQALDFRKPLKSSPAIEHLITKFRNYVPFVAADTYMKPLMDKAYQFILEHKVEQIAK
ncbi:MAG: histidine ammonia-lyase [Flavobacteriales bacterium]|nr:histidine ammonia-lyase [Flavobacteriales bacterium]